MNHSISASAFATLQDILAVSPHIVPDRRWTKQPDRIRSEAIADALAAAPGMVIVDWADPPDTTAQAIARIAPAVRLPADLCGETVEEALLAYHATDPDPVILVNGGWSSNDAVLLLALRRDRAEELLRHAELGQHFMVAGTDRDTRKDAIYIDRGADRAIDPGAVPEALRSLIPLIRRWGISSPHKQDRFLGELRRKRPQEVQAFRAAMEPARAAIHAWLAALPEKHLQEMTKTDWDHPGWSFGAALSMLDLVGPDPAAPPDPALLRIWEAMAVERRESQFQSALATADDQFRAGNYQAYVDLMTPFADLLNGSQMTKMKVAKKKLAPP